MSEHSINRSGTTGNSHDEHTDDDAPDEQDEQRSGAETKRELRKSAVGQAILRRNRELKRRQGRR